MTSIAVQDRLGDAVGDVIDRVVTPEAIGVDVDGRFPSASIDALREAGALGVLSAPEVGGAGGSLRDAVEIVRRLAGACGSTAMVMTMHYAATAVLEAHADDEMRRRAASGEVLATLAFSERGSRSHFWAPVGTATRVDGAIRLDAEKSWVTSAGEADVYVWSSVPLAAEGASTIWAVPADTPGLRSPIPFDGLGLRGNASSPVIGEGVIVPATAMLGDDGAGFEVMMGIVLPAFSLMSAAMSVGTMEAAVAAAAAHVGATDLQHLGQSLAELPTVRAYVARARIATDLTAALLDDTLRAVEEGREDANLRVLEVKAAAGENATTVTDLAMRVCGGAAFRKEAGIERRFRDARAASVMAPTTDVLYDFIGKVTCGLPLF
jgi:alkylation response protein AidB-like acyl-CoA dehydrogenase